MVLFREKYVSSVFELVVLFQKYSKCSDLFILNALQNNLSRFMKFKRSYSNSRDLGSVLSAEI